MRFLFRLDENVYLSNSVTLNDKIISLYTIYAIIPNFSFVI